MLSWVLFLRVVCVFCRFSVYLEPGWMGVSTVGMLCVLVSRRKEVHYFYTLFDASSLGVSSAPILVSLSIVHHHHPCDGAVRPRKNLLNPPPPPLPDYYDDDEAACVVCPLYRGSTGRKASFFALSFLRLLSSRVVRQLYRPEISFERLP